MATIKINGSSIVLKSSLKLEDLKKLEKYRPSALEEKDDKEKLVFKIGVAQTGRGNQCAKAVLFAPVTHDPEGFATVTLDIPDDVKNAREYAADLLAIAYKGLKGMEPGLAEAVRQVDADKEEMLAQIQQ